MPTVEKELVAKGLRNVHTCLHPCPLGPVRVCADLPALAPGAVTSPSALAASKAMSLRQNSKLTVSTASYASHKGPPAPRPNRSSYGRARQRAVCYRAGRPASHLSGPGPMPCSAGPSDRSCPGALRACTTPQLGERPGLTLQASPRLLWPWRTNATRRSTQPPLLSLSSSHPLSLVLGCTVMFDLATLWTAAPQALQSMGFSRPEYWSGLRCPPPGESSQPRDRTQVSHIAGGFFTA